MYLTYQEMLYIVTTVSLMFITVFLCWALYQLAIALRNANDILMDTKDKMNRVEKAVHGFTDKLTSMTSYLAFIAEGGKQLLGLLRGKDSNSEEVSVKKVSAKRSKKVLSEWEE